MRILIAPVVLALGLVACGGSSKTATTAATTATTTAASGGVTTIAAATSATSTAATGTAGGDLCRLVTAAEAQAILGRPVGAGKVTKGAASPTGEVGSCVYRATNDTGVIAKTIVNVAGFGTKVPRDAFFQQIGADAPTATKISGLGQDAFNVDGVVAVFDSGRAITVQIMVDGKPAPQATSVDLARKVLTRY